MSEQGIILKISGDRALVALEPTTQCQACGACRFSDTDRKMMAEAGNPIGAKAGDLVAVELEPKLLLTAAFVVYMLPLLMMFIGYALGFWLVSRLAPSLGPEGSGIAGGLVLLVGSYFLVKRIDRSANRSRRFEPRIYDIIREN